jgi:membrane-associated protease RseP (regulator of RpoE activity)
MTRWIGVVSVTFLVGLLAGVLTHRAFSAGEPAPATEPPRTVSTPADPRAVRPPELTSPREGRPGDAAWVAEIVARLDRAAAERHQLQQEVAELHAKVRALEARITPVDRESAGSAAPGEPAPPASAKKDEAADPAIPLVTRLTALGVDQDRAAEIAQRVNEVDLDRLYLRDQATREGWFNTPRYGQALQEVNGDLSALRDDVGDDAYDRYLYATGQVNRVVVGSVIAGSAAEEAGIKPGDTVLQYDDRRVFSTPELQSATTEGVAGDAVTVTVLRGGQRLRLYVARGPLGIRLVTERRPPEPRP